jgi:phage terminase large subunit-like protein
MRRCEINKDLEMVRTGIVEQDGMVPIHEMVAEKEKAAREEVVVIFRGLRSRHRRHQS